MFLFYIYSINNIYKLIFTINTKYLIIIEDMNIRWLRSLLIDPIDYFSKLISILFQFNFFFLKFKIK